MSRRVTRKARARSVPITSTAAPAASSLDLEQQDYTDTTKWTLVPAVDGAVYRFMGPSGTEAHLGDGTLYAAGKNGGNPTAITTVNPGYSDLGYWQRVPKSQLTPSTDKNNKAISGSASGASVGGIVVVNEVHGGANAIVQTSNVTGASLAVTALGQCASITATTDATATTSSQARPSAARFVDDACGQRRRSRSTRSWATPTRISPAAAPSPRPAATIVVAATNYRHDHGFDTRERRFGDSARAVAAAVGVVLAFNTIGSAFQDLLASTVDTIAAGDVIGSSSDADAYDGLSRGFDRQLPWRHPVGHGRIRRKTIDATVGNTTRRCRAELAGNKSFSASAS